MKKKLVIKISLLTSLVLIIISVISCSVLAYNDNKILSEGLIELASTYAQVLEASDPDTVVKTDKLAQTRITVIDGSGNVVADSYGGEGAMDNHLSREEIVNANKATNNKVVKRYSQTARTNLMYYAVKATSGGVQYYLRVSRHTADLTVYLATSITVVIAASVALTVLVSLLAGRFAKTTMRPLGELAVSLKAVREGHFSPVMPHEDSDEMNMLISKVNDISEMLAANLREINFQKDKLDYLLENMSQAVIALDKKDCVMFSNERAGQLFGAKNMLGLSAIAAIHESDIIAKFKSMPSTGIEMFIWEKNSKYYRVSINKLPESDNDLKAIILVSDITKLKIAEVERKQFFANCSHELKTPLTTIKGYAELVSSGIVKPVKVQEYNASIVKESERLLSMINDMLILSRLDENIDSGVKANLSLATELNRLLESYQIKLDAKKIVATLSGDSMVNISPESINTILTNIISNAIKYNVEGGTIAIDIKSAKKQTTLKITDSGIGIAPKDISRVTERFYRVDSSRTDGDSSGLGLAIVKHICMNNNIKFSIKSKLNSGTTVELVFEGAEALIE